MSIKIIPYDDEFAANLHMNWQVEEFYSQKLTIRVEFEKPLSVSNPNPDEIEVKF